MFGSASCPCFSPALTKDPCALGILIVTDLNKNNEATGYEASMLPWIKVPIKSELYVIFKK